MPTLDFPANADAARGPDPRRHRRRRVVDTCRSARRRSAPGRPAGGSQLGLPVTRRSPRRADRQRRAARPGRAVQPVPPGPGAERRRDRPDRGQPSSASPTWQHQPAIFIGGQPFTVIGILVRRRAAAAAEPRRDRAGRTPRYAVGRRRPAQGAQMLIHTRLGAAQVVARQVPVALRPDNPKLLTAAAPASPAQLRHSVTTSLNTLFLALAGIALVVGAIGIANTTLVAVLERVRRDRPAPGARRPAPAHRGPVPGRVDGARPVRRADRGQPGRAGRARGHDLPPLDRAARPAAGAGRPAGRRASSACWPASTRRCGRAPSSPPMRCAADRGRPGG